MLICLEYRELMKDIKIVTSYKYLGVHLNDKLE